MKTVDQIIEFVDSLPIRKSGDWPEYERVKQYLAVKAEDGREYEIACRRLAERLGL